MRDGSETPILIVDGRQDPKFTRALRAHFEVRERQLKTGDFLWSCPLGTVGVEDKGSKDLVASLHTRRLDDELRRLVETVSIPILFIRGTGEGQYNRLSAEALEKLKFGRQLHGVYVWQAPADIAEAALSLRHLYDYLAKERSRGIEGTRRAKYAFAGPLNPTAELVYTILGFAGGVRDRRGLALKIASATPLHDFLRWTALDFESAGFSRLMARKLAQVLRTLEEPNGTTRRRPS